MKSANGRSAWALGVLAASLMVLIGPSLAGSSRATASPTILVLPIPPGETWHVCQGYNGELTHDGIPALDLSRARQSIGSKGCKAGSKFSSAGSVVSSPAAGTAYRWPGCCGDDFVCVNFDSGGSAAIGHLSERVPDGTRVATGARIGTVAWPHTSNGNYAHIHVQVHAGPDCTEGSDPVAFDVAHGFRWACNPDLPYSGEPNQYAGLSVSRCSAAGGVREKKAEPELDAGIGGPTWLAAMVARSIRMVSVSIAGPA